MQAAALQGPTWTADSWGGRLNGFGQQETLRMIPAKKTPVPPGVIEGLLEVAGIAFVQVVEDSHISSWNAGATNILGWSVAEAIGAPVEKIFGDRPLAPPNGSARWTASFHTKEGNLVEVEVSEGRAPAQKNEKGTRCFLLRDITEEKFLERALLEAADREQRRIGQDLHDHLCQHLLGAAFAAKAQAGALDREASPHAPELHELARLINDAVSQVRDISRGLHPVELDSAGLMSALHELAHRVNASVPCTFRCDRKVLVKDAHRALHAYRIGQEAIANALQQTKARHIVITLSESGKSARLEVSDDGAVEGELTSEGNGTLAKTLQYRAQAINGLMTATFQRGKGTRVACIFPKSS